MDGKLTPMQMASSDSVGNLGTNLNPDLISYSDNGLILQTTWMLDSSLSSSLLLSIPELIDEAKLVVLSFMILPSFMSIVVVAVDGDESDSRFRRRLQPAKEEEKESQQKMHWK